MEWTEYSIYVCAWGSMCKNEPQMMRSALKWENNSRCAYRYISHWVIVVPTDTTTYNKYYGSIEESDGAPWNIMEYSL